MVYAESSAVLAWLLGEPAGEAIRAQLAETDFVVASVLTLIECDRVLIRASALGALSEADFTSRRAFLNRAAASWVILQVDDEIVERSRRPFPIEPIRTLDAMHLASALSVRSAVAQTAILSLDQRIRDCATQLGFEVVPAPAT